MQRGKILPASLADAQAGRKDVPVNELSSCHLKSPERMFYDSGATTLATSAPTCEKRHPLGIQEFGLRHLRTSSEIEKILHLREAIDLSVHTRAHTDFLALEKKETSAVSSGPSNCAGKS